MNIPFDIVKGKGPIIFDPPSTTADVEQVREFIPEESVPYVGEALKILRKEVFFFPLFCFLCLMSSGNYGRYKNRSTVMIVVYYLKRKIEQNWKKNDQNLEQVERPGEV